MTLATTQDLLLEYTTDKQILEELEAYTQNAFQASEQSLDYSELSDEPQVATWEKYAKEAADCGVYDTLKKYLVQLQFPIRAQMSAAPNYLQATRRGQSTKEMEEATGLELVCPDKLELFLYRSVAGRIPVIVTKDRQDFKSIFRALCCRNEPRSMPDSMGAVLIRGLNNWDRVRQVKQDAITGKITGDWRQQRAHYQDSIILLSRIPYSNVSASEMNLPEEKWLDQSLQIRLAHECAHYYTLRQYGSMSANMHDELIADYMGICAVRQQFSADWFLRFIGLENYPDCRPGGRLQNYLGDPPLSSAAREVLQTILYRAAQNATIFDEQIGKQEDIQRLMRLQVLCSLNLVEMAALNGVSRMLDHYYESLKTAQQ